MTNLLTDFPDLTIAVDSLAKRLCQRVDRELISNPQRMDIKFTSNFMAAFGLLSSVFDYLTFGALLLLPHARPEQFRTVWFMESIL